VAVPADVTDESSVANGCEQIVASLGPVDVLVNNAGVSMAMGEMWDVEPQRWWYTVEVNLRGTYLCSRAILPSMVQRKTGRIINVVSRAGAHRWPYFTAYAVSKAAVIKLTESLAAETRDYGVSVFAIHPGLVRAGLTDSPPDFRPEDREIAGRVQNWFEQQFAEGKTVSAEEAAAFVADLASAPADGLSGRYVAIDDDLDALIEQADEVRRQNLQALKLERLNGLAP
jgi:NAD(P)-dependent dehydrogenase (short-subunit alcohol dehydrogenase family)